MGQVIHTSPTLLDDEDFGWMVGRGIENVRFSEPCSWWFWLSAGGMVTTEEAWRITSTSKMIICSSDHGHQFGRPAPVDAVAEARMALKDASILEARVRSGVPDLTLIFSNGLILEFLCLSVAYECWQLRDPSGRCIVVHGSRHASTWQEQVRDPGEGG